MTQPLIQEAQLDPSIELGGGGAGGAPPTFEIAVLGSPAASYTATIISATKPAGGSPPTNTTGVLVYVNGVQQAESPGSPATPGGNFVYDYGAQTVNFNPGSVPSPGDTIALYAVSGVSGETSGGPARFTVGPFPGSPTLGSPTIAWAAKGVNATAPSGNRETSIQVFVNGLQQAEDVDFTYDYVLDQVNFIAGSPTSVPLFGSIVSLNTVGGSVFERDSVAAGEGLVLTSGGSPNPPIMSLDSADNRNIDHGAVQIIAGGGVFLSGGGSPIGSLKSDITLSILASEGILVNAGSKVIELDFINLDHGSPGAPDPDNDLVCYYDNSLDLHRKLSLAEFAEKAIWQSGSFVPQWTGFGSPTPVGVMNTINYRYIPGFMAIWDNNSGNVGLGDAGTTMTITNVPATISPTNQQDTNPQISNNGVITWGYMAVNSAGVATFGTGVAGGGFTSATNRGWPGTWNAMYPLN